MQRWLNSIKGLRWLLLNRADNLKKDAAKRLGRSLKINEPLQCAYLLKEELGELWMQSDGNPELPQNRPDQWKNGRNQPKNPRFASQCLRVS